MFVFVVVCIYCWGLIYCGDLIILSILNSKDLYYVLCDKLLDKDEWYEVGWVLVVMYNC